MTRKDLIRKLHAQLGNKKLVWFGTRGEDAQALLDLPQFSEVFSLIAPFGSVSMNVDACLEQLTGKRVDLDTYNLDEDKSPEARELRRRLFLSLGEPAVVVPYRPLAFLSSVQYPRAEYVEYLGLFHERQAPFEHKPWVESELKRQGLRVVPWRYYTDDDRLRVEEQVDALGPVVIRSNRSDGGAGLSVARTRDEVASAWRPQADGFLAAAPLLTPHVPLNISACVFADGRVSLHPPSLQLLGVPVCTNRTFGYCGNDFAAVRDLDARHLDELQALVVAVGRWLAARGFLGAFGVDAMLHDGRVLLAEVNPRFQGSSALSAWIDGELDRPDIFLCHIAAFLGLSASSNESLRDLVRTQPPVAQIICHNRAQGPVRRVAELPAEAGRGVRCNLVPGPDVLISPEAALFRVFAPGPVTTDGFSLEAGWAAQAARWVARGFGLAPTVMAEEGQPCASPSS